MIRQGILINIPYVTKGNKDGHSHLKGVRINSSIKGEHLTSQDNLKAIINSLPSDTPEVTHIILKSQIKSKAKRPSLSKNV